MKRILVLLLSLLLLGGCGHTQQEEPLPSMTEPMAADHTQWQQEPYYVLQFNVDSVISNAPAAAATSAGVVLTQGGTYLLSGTLQDAQLIIDVPSGETVRLVLRGVDLHSERGPVIYSKGGCTVVLLLEEGTVNTLTDGKNYLYTGGVMREAVISVTGSLLITGSGSLAVEATHADAIRSESDLVVAAGSKASPAAIPACLPPRKNPGRAVCCFPAAIPPLSAAEMAFGRPVLFQLPAAVIISPQAAAAVTAAMAKMPKNGACGAACSRNSYRSRRALFPPGKHRSAPVRAAFPPASLWCWAAAALPSIAAMMLCILPAACCFPAAAQSFPAGMTPFLQPVRSRFLLAKLPSIPPAVALPRNP